MLVAKQVVATSCCEAVPAAQSMQAEAATREYFPASQAPQSSA